MRSTQAEGLGEIGPDVPLRLEDAARIAFPGGGMTVSGLRRERDRGRLAVEKVAGKEYTTLSAIKEMRRLCRVQQKESVSGSEKPKASDPPPGSSATDAVQSGLAFLQTLSEKLNFEKPPTPKPNTKRRASNVVSMR